MKTRRNSHREILRSVSLPSSFAGDASVLFDPLGASSRERVPHRATGPSISQAASHGGDGDGDGDGDGGGGGGGGCDGSWRHERSRGTDI